MKSKRFEGVLRKQCAGYPIHRQLNHPDPLICAKLYWPIGNACWYITGYNSKTYVAYGVVVGVGPETWGRFFVPALLETKIAGVMPVKLDEDWRPVRVSKLGITRPSEALQW